MKGTEKQKKWAEAIKKELMLIVDEAVSACQSTNLKNEQKNVFIASMKKLKYNIENVDYAGDLISVFSHVKYTGDYKTDISAVRSAIKVGDVNKVFSKEVEGK